MSTTKRDGGVHSTSLSAQLDTLEWPVSREELVQSAMEAGADPDVINVLKSLPRAEYHDPNQVMRDLAEAARRFATGSPSDEDELRDRRDLGRDAVTRHP